MFRRSAVGLGFAPRDGDSVEVVIERAGFISLDNERDMIDFLVDKLDIDEGTVRTRLIKAKLLSEDT